MADRRLNIKANLELDTGAFDAQIRSMQNKINTSFGRTGMSAAGVAGRTDIFNRAFGANVMEKEYQDNMRHMREELIAMNKKKAELNGILTNERGITQEKEKQAKLQKEIAEHEMRGNQYAVRNQQLGDQAIAMGGNPSRFGRGGGGGSGGGFGGSFRGGGTFSGRALGVAAALGMAPGILSNIANEWFLKQGNIAINRGGVMGQIGAMAGQYEDPNQLLRAAAFGGERARALGIVGEEIQTQRMRDILSGVDSNLGKVSIGAGAGMAMGGPFGAFLGGSAALLLGGGKRTRGAILGTQEYRAQVTAEALKRSGEIEANLIAANIPKSLAMNAFQRNVGDITRAESTFGDIGAVGGGSFLRSIIGSGMTGKVGMNVAQQMMGMSGITPGAGDVGDIKNAFLLQQAGLTNAGKLTGAIRGLSRGFGNQSTDDSVRRLFSEAVKLGINDSKMVEEFRQFTSAATSLAMERGIRVEEAGFMLSRGSLGAMSLPNLRAAQTAAQMRDRESGFGSSEDLAYKMAFMSSQNAPAALGNLSGRDRIVMAGLRESEMSQDNPVVQSLMKNMGVDFDTFRQMHSEVNLASGIKRGPMRERARKMFDKLRGLSADDFKKAISPGGVAYEDLAELMKEGKIQRGDTYGAMGFRGQQAFELSRIATLAGGEYNSDVADMLKKMGAETVGARREEGMAIAEGRGYERMTAKDGGKRYIDSFLDSMKTAASGAQELNEVIEQFKKASNNSVDSLEKFATALNVHINYTASEQKQAAEMMGDLFEIGSNAIPNTGN